VRQRTGPSGLLPVDSLLVVAVEARASSPYPGPGGLRSSPSCPCRRRGRGGGPSWSAVWVPFRCEKAGKRHMGVVPLREGRKTPYGYHSAAGRPASAVWVSPPG